MVTVLDNSTRQNAYSTQCKIITYSYGHSVRQFYTSERLQYAVYDNHYRRPNLAGKGNFASYAGSSDAILCPCAAPGYSD